VHSRLSLFGAPSRLGENSISPPSGARVGEGGEEEEEEGSGEIAKRR